MRRPTSSIAILGRRERLTNKVGALGWTSADRTEAVYICIYIYIYICSHIYIYKITKRNQGGASIEWKSSRRDHEREIMQNGSYKSTNIGDITEKTSWEAQPGGNHGGKIIHPVGMLRNPLLRN